MKYMASQRPTMMNMNPVSWPRASGWRAMPAMVALPTTPSPIAAPIAPPPRAMPAAIIAPAVTVGSAILLNASSRSSSVVLVQAFPRLAEVDDGQQHEDEGLDRADEQHVEAFPDRQQRRSD